MSNGRCHFCGDETPLRYRFFSDEDPLRPGVTFAPLCEYCKASVKIVPLVPRRVWTEKEIQQLREEILGKGDGDE